MNPRLAFVVSFLLGLLTFAPPHLPAGWGSGGCATVAAPAPAGLTWSYQRNLRQSYLSRDGVVVGGFDHALRVYRTYDAASRTWSEPLPPPWDEERAVGAEPIKAPMSALAVQAAAEQTELLRNPGLAREKMRPIDEGEGEEYRINGVAVKAKAAKRAIDAPDQAAGDGLPDDGRLLRVTAWGSEEECAPVEAALKASGLLAKVMYQHFPASHWAGRPGFKTDGHPSFYVQAPHGMLVPWRDPSGATKLRAAVGGEVLHRHDGARTPEQVVQAVRRADPNYDAKKDPDLKDPPPSPTPDLPPEAIGTVVAALGLAGTLLFRRSP